VVAHAATLMAAHAATPPAFSISASPPSVRLDAGTATAIRVTDTGAKPIDVHVSLAAVAKSGDKCGVSGPASGWGVSVGGPSSFTLNPGQFRTVPVTVAANAKAQDDALIFASSAGDGNANARISGAVGSQLIIGGSTECVTAPAAAAASAHGGSAAAGAGIVGGLIAALTGAVLAVRRRIRRRPDRAARKLQAARDLLASAEGQ
jgi:hypothetical protein